MSYTRLATSEFTLLIRCETSLGNILVTQQSGVISLLSDACPSWTVQADITSGSQAVKLRLCGSLQVCHSSTCPGRRNGSAEPDTLQGSLPTASLASGHGTGFHLLRYETGPACL